MSAKRSADANGDGDVERPTWRPSGVRRAVGNASELLHKLAARDVDDEGGGSIYEVLERTAVVVGAPGRVDLMSLDARARWLLPFLDGTASVERAMQSSGMPPVDALLAMCELVARGIVSLAPPRSSEPSRCG
jgi:hypothetical protein